MLTQQPKTIYTDSTICQRKSRRKITNVSKLIANVILTRNLKLNLSSESTRNCKSLIGMELLLNISILLSMAFVTEARQQFQSLRSTLLIIIIII